MRFHSYLNSAATIIGEYNGNTPFALWVKEYFRANKKYGSTDRKQIAHFCYCYFRLGKSFMTTPLEERILIGLFLCSTESNEALKQLRPEWNQKAGQNLQDKFASLTSAEPGPSAADVFPWVNELSKDVNHQEFCKSFFVQPDLFLRIRPGYEIVVREKLLKAKVYFTDLSSSCLSLQNASKVIQSRPSGESIIELDKEAVIQDYSSQKVGEMLQSAIPSRPRVPEGRSPSGLKSPTKTWDCCSGSGGKSLLLHDICPAVDLTVSDVRESILINLKKRFAKAGIRRYKSFVADITSQQSKVIGSVPNSKFDLIICDTPCTGSGTWSRTPEQLYYFDEKKITYYASLQERIVSNVVPQLKKDGFLVYITCSVFKKENEEQVENFRRRFNLKTTATALLKGYDKKADTLFVSVLCRS